MKPKIIYVYDALCGWCYGFSPVILAVRENYSNDFDFEVLSGGMVLGDRTGPIGEVAAYIRSGYKTVEETTGIVFGQGFLHNLEKGEMVFDSEMPAIALSVFKSLIPQKAVEFAHHLQSCIYFDGKHPADIELYRYLAVNFGIDPDGFEGKMNDQQFKDAAYYDFALAKQLQVNGYPAVLIQQSETKLYLIARGYTDYQSMELRISNVKKEMLDQS